MSFIDKEIYISQRCYNVMRRHSGITKKVLFLSMCNIQMQMKYDH